jgi:hypothetical protein
MVPGGALAAGMGSSLWESLDWRMLLPGSTSQQMRLLSEDNWAESGSWEFPWHPQESKVRTQRLPWLLKQSKWNHSGLYGVGPRQVQLATILLGKLLLGRLGKGRRQGQGLPTWSSAERGALVGGSAFSGPRTARQTCYSCKNSLGLWGVSPCRCMLSNTEAGTLQAASKC